MDEIKRIPTIEFNEVQIRTNFNRVKLTKDYFITLLLYLIKDVEGIYFKGGTAINKIFLNHARLSEDIDFALTENVVKVNKEIQEIIEKSDIFERMTEEKNVEGFLRIVVWYKGFEDEKDHIFIDLNQREKIILPTEFSEVKHFYSHFIPEFSIKIINKEEMIADKVAATIGRNKPRDHLDIYNIIHAKIPINMKLAKKKCQAAGDEFSLIKMFNKAKTLKNRWDKDMASLIAEPVKFKKVIQYLAKHFNLKEEKVRLVKRV